MVYKNGDPLDQYVWSQIPKLKTIPSESLEAMFEDFSPDDLVRNSQMSADELTNTFRLSYITESLTEQYAATFHEGARKYNAKWLSDYITGFWEPDEKGHADPFRNVLTDFGIDKRTLDDEVHQAHEQTNYSSKHGSGLHPISLTTYGLIQECITDYWYELQRSFFPSTSHTSKAIGLVKGREALHTVQFKTLTAMQLEQDPLLLELIINTIKNFQMPANHIPTISHIEQQTQNWIPHMNGSVYELLKRILGKIYDALQDTSSFGKILLEYASESEQRILSLLPNKFTSRVISSMRGGPGFVGELILESLGIIPNEIEAPKTNFETVQYRLKQIVKRWVKEQVRLEDFLGNAPTVKS